MSTLYQRRVEQEWRLLELLARANPNILENIKRDQEWTEKFLGFTLHQTQALIGKAEGFQFLNSHQAHLYFPKIFPFNSD